MKKVLELPEEFKMKAYIGEEPQKNRSVYEPNWILIDYVPMQNFGFTLKTTFRARKEAEKFAESSVKRRIKEEETELKKLTRILAKRPWEEKK